MTVLDAYAILAYLRDEPAAAQVVPLLDRADCLATSVGVAEVMDVMIRVDGASEDEAALILAQLPLLEPVAVDAALAAAAGRLRARHYHRVRRTVSMADCIAAGAADKLGRPLATADPHLLDLCQDEGIETVVLRGTDGSAWAALQ